MALKDLFNTMKSEGIVLPRLDRYLLTNNDPSEMHSHAYTSPSGIYSCIRSQMYRVMGERKDGSPNPRLQRIFDMGHKIHEMLQGYLKDEGILLLDEAPVYSDKYKVMGHTDGILQISPVALGILEIKSINSDGFKNLLAAKPDHIKQANVYMLCLEELRSRVNNAKTRLHFVNIKKKILAEYADFLDTFIVGGRKFSKEEKVNYKLKQMENLIELLYNYQKKIDTIVFIYMNKDSQEIKEFIVNWDDAIIAEIQDRCALIDDYRQTNKLPDRPEYATGKTCSFCRYCDYKMACYK